METFKKRRDSDNNNGKEFGQVKTKSRPSKSTAKKKPAPPKQPEEQPIKTRFGDDDDPENLPIPAPLELCGLCSAIVTVDSIVTIYPCGHTLHLACMYQKSDIKECLDSCPVCQDPPCPVKASHVCLIRSFKTVKTALSVGRSSKEVLSEMRLDLLRQLAEKTYKTKITELQEWEAMITSDVQSRPIFGSKTKEVNADTNEDMGFKGDISNLIRSKESIVSMCKKHITWYEMIEQQVDIGQWFECGYNILDAFLLFADWDGLISAGLCPDHFVKYPKQIDISSILRYYRLKFLNVWKDLCSCDVDQMAKLGLGLAEMQFLNFSKAYWTTKKRRSVEDIMNSKWWKTLTLEEWAKLGFEVQ